MSERDEYDDLILNSERSSLYCSIRDGIVAIKYFTMSDIYSSYYVRLYYDDLCDICEFLDHWGSESVEITQPYSCTVNGHPSFCVLKFEYVKNEDPEERIRDTLQRITFYARCWGDDLQSSLDEDKFLNWTSWDDYYFWDEFKELKAFLHQTKRLMERCRGEDE